MFSENLAVLISTCPGTRHGLSIEDYELRLIITKRLLSKSAHPFFKVKPSLASFPFLQLLSAAQAVDLTATPISGSMKYS
jgi:hypothetical protein